MDIGMSRAIFTPKYKPVDNFEICERLDSLGYRPDTQVQCSLDPEFMSLSILDGKKSFDINGDKFRPGISISNSEVGLASLSIAAFILRLVCTNGMVSKTEISPHLTGTYPRKILDEFPATMDKVSYELGAQKHKIGLSMESPVDDPLKTIESFNRQFNLNQPQKDAVEWAWSREAGGLRCSAVVNTYTQCFPDERICQLRIQLSLTAGWWRGIYGYAQLSPENGNCPVVRAIFLIRICSINIIS